MRQVGRRGDKIVGERPRDQVARGVVDGFLIQCLGDALGYAPLDVALDDQWVDHRAEVVDRYVRTDRNVAGFGVDLYGAQVARRVNEKLSGS